MCNLNIILAYGIAIQIVGLTIAQQVAPGISPDVYRQYNQGENVQYQPQYQHQGAAPNAQYQQRQAAPNQGNVQYQGAPNVQYQQQPIEQQQQQQQYQQAQQQPPVQQGGHGHGHGHGHDRPQPLGGNVKEEREHIAEHMDVPIDTSKMSEQELQFHYFKMHDSDNNNKLDGSELIKSLIHWHEQGSKEKQNNPQQPQVEDKVFTDDELMSLIDPILKMDDTSNDGYIDYPEFIRAQQKAAANQQPSQP